MKKFIRIFAVFLCALQINYVFAVTMINANFKIDKTVINQNDEIKLTLELNEFQDIGEGINAFIGTLNFDSEKFEVINIEGGNSWNNPIFNKNTLNEGKTKIAMTKNDFSSEEGDILEITLKAKKDINDYTELNIEDMSVAVKINGNTKKININNKKIALNEKEVVKNVSEKEQIKSNNQGIIIWCVVVCLIFLIFIATIVRFFCFRKGGNK